MCQQLIQFVEDFCQRHQAAFKIVITFQNPLFNPSQTERLWRFFINIGNVLHPLLRDTRIVEQSHEVLNTTLEEFNNNSDNH